MSDAIAIDTLCPWHHSVHKCPLSSVKSESKGDELVAEYTNPAPYACFEHTEQSQHGQWCQRLSHRGAMGKTGLQQAVAPFSTSSGQNGTLMTITSWATSFLLGLNTNELKKYVHWRDTVHNEGIIWGHVAYNLGIKWILTEGCHKTMMLTKMFIGFINKCVMCNNYLIVEYKHIITPRESYCQLWRGNYHICGSCRNNKI